MYVIAVPKTSSSVGTLNFSITFLQMWTPHAEVPSMVAGGTAGPETADVLSVVETNQRKLRRNREAVL